MKIFGSIAELLNLVFRKNSQQITVRPNQATTYTAARDIQLPPGDADHVMLSASSSQMVSNKTLDSTNSITLNDSTAQVVDNADPTKKILFNAAGTAGTSTTILSSQTANQVLTLPDATDTVAVLAASQALANKTLDGSNSITLKDSTAQVVDATDATKKILFDAAGTTGTSTTITGSQTANRVLTLPDATDTLVARGTTETLMNKKLSDSTTSVVDVSDATIAIKFDAGGNTGTSTTIQGAQTANRVLTLPDATDTLTANSASQSLTNKNLASSTNTLTGATAASFANSGTITLPTGTRTLVARDTTDILTNKDIDGGTASSSSRITVPKDTKSNLDALTRKQATIVYGSDTNKLYTDNGTSLQEVGSGSSGINYLSAHFAADSLGTTDVSLGDTLASSTRSNPSRWGSSAGSSLITQSTDSTLRSTTNYLVQFTANAQFVESPLFTLDGSDLGKALLVQFDVSGVGTSDDVQCYVVRYDSSNVLQERIVVAGTASATTPFSARVPTGTTTFRGFFVAGATASDKYAIRWLRNATNTSMRLDALVVGPQSVMTGTAITDWQSYTPTWGASTTNPTIGNGVLIGYYRRVGDSMQVVIKITAGSTTTFGSGNYNFGLPSGFNIDTSKVAIEAQASYTFGTAMLNSALEWNLGIINNGTSTTSVSAIPYNNGNFVGPTVPETWVNSTRFSANFVVPIVGWSSNVTTADRAVEEYASNSDSTPTSNSTSFAYGASGSLLPQSAAAVASFDKTVRFTTPILPTDAIVLEVSDTTGTRWAPLTAKNDDLDVSPYVVQGTVNYGIYCFPINSTDVRVRFGRYRYPSSASYADVGSNWTSQTSRWRLRKISGGAAVGFPIQSPNVTARIDGNPQPSNYIGELFGTQRAGTNGAAYTDRSTTVFTPSDVVVLSRALNKGIYLLSYTCSTLSSTTNQDIYSYVTVGGTQVSNLTRWGTYSSAGIYTTGSQTLPLVINADGTTVAVRGVVSTSLVSQINEMSIVRIA